MTDVTIPDDIWPSDSGGVISAWLYADGEYVTKDLLIAELMSEKAIIELRSPETGTLTIFVGVDQPVRAGEVVARVKSGNDTEPL